MADPFGTGSSKADESRTLFPERNRRAGRRRQSGRFPASLSAKPAAARPKVLIGPGGAACCCAGEDGRPGAAGLIPFLLLTYTKAAASEMLSRLLQKHSAAGR